jgi:hypothetical protein
LAWESPRERLGSKEHALWLGAFEGLDEALVVSLRVLAFHFLAVFL